MDRTEKAVLVEALRERFERAPAVYLTDFTGLDVKDITKLRRELKGSGGEYLVAKNRLVKLSIADSGLPDISEGLSGPTGLAFGYADVVATAKAISDFATEHEDRPVFKLGVLESSLLAPEEIQALAKLPSRDTLLAQLAGALEAPMAALAGALEGKLQEAAGLLDVLIEQRAEANPA
ncbi:MAG: 50S ribosomal protein L10 [Gemmatimonadetes bacterium]|nr:50S ribosomal protein L10 [Gemmatimonadota bacterium]